MTCNYRADLRGEEKSVEKYAIPFILGIYAETAIVGRDCLGLAAEKRDKIHVKMTGAGFDLTAGFPAGMAWVGQGRGRGGEMVCGFG